MPLKPVRSCRELGVLNDSLRTGQEVLPSGRQEVVRRVHPTIDTGKQRLGWYWLPC